MITYFQATIALIMFSWTTHFVRCESLNLFILFMWLTICQKSDWLKDSCSHLLGWVLWSWLFMIVVILSWSWPNFSDMPKIHELVRLYWSSSLLSGWSPGEINQTQFLMFLVFWSKQKITVCDIKGGFANFYFLVKGLSSLNAPTYILHNVGTL